MPEFNYPPSIPILQSLIGISLVADLDNISKSVRLWYTLTELVSDFPTDEFTDEEWRNHLYDSANKDRNKKPEYAENCISNKTIKEILFGQYDDENWNRWKQSFVNSCLGVNKNYATKSELEEYTKVLESEKPFYVTGKTILNDLKNLARRGYLQSIGFSKFILVDKLPIIETEVTANLPADFYSIANLFWQKPNDIQRFYLHSDYQTLDRNEGIITDHREKLREIWKDGNAAPCKLTYKSSSSQKQIYTAVVYPACIYYYQRSYYLCAFGRKEDEIEIESNWYNYRLDRIQSLECLEWKDSSIPLDLIEKCRDVDDNELIYDIESGMGEAYGFDIERSNQLMLLRFERDFHDRYIKNTWRHNTFKQVSREQVSNFISRKIVNKSDIALLNKKLNNHPIDAIYYKMNYRVGDNSVIMRLRAWCPNVEVLFPLDLRQRMRDDMKKTCELYSGDEIE
jgi:CRISPR-associated protein (TIGR03985 family)